MSEEGKEKSSPQREQRERRGSGELKGKTMDISDQISDIRRPMGATSDRRAAIRK
jgi:hypothetical protein